MRALSIELTNACPWRCSTCLPASGLPRRDEMTNAELVELLTTAAELGTLSVYYSGGEPLSRSDTPAVLAEGARLGLRQSLVTSGAGLTGELSARLAELGVGVYVSLDGDTAARNDAVRGEGSFATATAALELASRAGVLTGLSVTVTRHNAPRLDGIERLGRALGSSRSTYSEVVRGGRARANWTELELKDGDRGAIRDWLDTVDPSAPQADDDSCWVDGDSVHISSDGRVYLCSEIFQRAAAFRLGSARPRQSLRAALASADTHDHSALRCRYEVVVRGTVTAVLHAGRDCSLLPILRRDTVPVRSSERTGAGEEVVRR